MLRSRSLFCVFCPLIGLALALLYLFLATPSAMAQPAQKEPVSFIQDVAPILKENCFGCHNPKKKAGKFDMTTYENFRKGGRNDDPVVPGRAKSSYIMDVLTATDASRMPPKEAGHPLSKAQLAVIASWIDQGAKLDNGIKPQDDLLTELRKRWQPPALLAKYARPAVINSLAFTPDSKKIVTSGYHELLVWDVESGKLEKRLHTRAERAHDMEFLPDGKLAVAGGRPGQEGDVRIYDLNGKSKMENGVAVLDGVNDPSVLVAQLAQTDDVILSLDLSDDGKKLASAGTDRLVRVWDLSAGAAQAKLVDTIENHADWVFSVNFSPSGEVLVTASRDKSAKVWDLKAKESLATFQDHKESVYGAVMAADNKSAISVGEDHNLRWWDADPKSKNVGKQKRTAGGHSKVILQLVERRDGKNQILATASADGSVRLWNGVTGQAIKTLTGLPDWVYAVALSPDGKLVAGGGFAGEVRIWKIDDGKELRVLNASPGYEAPKAVQAK